MTRCVEYFAPLLQAINHLSGGSIIEKKFSHPHDTVISSGLRFLSELITWIAGPWAVAMYSKWLVFPALILLVGLPSIFSTTNDKNNIVVPTSGPVRVSIELFLFLVAAVAPWFIWSPTVSSVAVGIVIATIVAGAPRFAWLMRGAPIENG
jgi:hypothetical protein